MKILGIFARLSSEEARDGYLAHMPRLREYLGRNLAHPVLSDLALWYEELLSARRSSQLMNVNPSGFVLKSPPSGAPESVRWCWPPGLASACGH